MCRNAEQGAGVSVGRAVIWLCNEDIGLGRAVKVARRNGVLGRFEREAMIAAGDKAGQWLDDLGRTDLATLNREEWLTFLETFLDAYGASIREKLGAT